MSTASARTRRWKRIEYEQLIDRGIFQPGERLELIGGQLVVREPQGGAHALGIELVAEALREAFGATARVRVQLPIALDDESEPEPDVSVVSGPLADADPALPSAGAAHRRGQRLEPGAGPHREGQPLRARRDRRLLDPQSRGACARGPPRADARIDGPLRLALPPDPPPRRRRHRLTAGRTRLPHPRRPPDPLIRTRPPIRRARRSGLARRSAVPADPVPADPPCTHDCGRASGDRAGGAAGAGGMGSAEPFPPRETTTQRPQSGNGSPGDRYEVGGGQRTHPPGPRRATRPPRVWSFARVRDARDRDQAVAWMRLRSFG